MAGLNTNRGAKRAREARGAVDLDAATDVDCLLTVLEQRAGHQVVVACLPKDVAGACFRNGQGALLWVNGNQPLVRQRFTLAHEFAHAYCRHDAPLAVDSVRAISGQTTNPCEIQANAFAAEFLLPRPAVEARIQREPTLEDVVRIAVEYGVSAIVVLYRLKRLKLASESRLLRLEAEIGEGLHEALLTHLDLTMVDDALSRVKQLPYLSPSLRESALAAALRSHGAAGGAVARSLQRLMV